MVFTKESIILVSVKYKSRYMMDMVRIKLFKNELAWCQRHAEDIVNHYGGEGSGGSGSYNHNKVSSNLVGVKSEVATKVWFKQFLPLEIIECNYEKFGDEAKMLVGDLNIGGQSFEIKGLQPYQWDKFKRMVPPRQLHHYVQDNAIIIWTTATGDTKDSKVYLKGWNYAHEVRSKGINVVTICDNVWLENDADMREMQELKPILQTLK